MGKNTSERVLRDWLAAERPNISAATSIFYSGIVIALEKSHDGVTVAFAPAKTTRDRAGRVSEAAVAMLMDTKCNVRVPGSCYTP
jgi:hypothetical protein